MGVNNQKAQFAQMMMNPERIKKEKANEISLKELAINLPLENIEAPSAPSLELSPSAVVNVAKLPNVAIGMDGGMAPGKQEQALDINECTRYPSSAEQRKWCDVNYGLQGNSKCVESFCSFCCSFIIPPHKQGTLSAQCNKMCDALAPPEPPKWAQCTTPAKSADSI